MSTRAREACPTCSSRRWVVIATDGTGGTTEEWMPCENPNCTAKDEKMERSRGQRLTEAERATVMEVLRDNPKRSDREVAAALEGMGISISAASIGVTYRPKLNGNANGNGHKPKAERPQVSRAPAVVVEEVEEAEPEIESLPYQLYQLEDGRVQVTVDIATTAKHALAIIAAVNNALLGG